MRTVANKTIADDYFDYYTTYKKEYGDKVCVMMQIGSFYEMQMIDNQKEKIGNLHQICNLLNIQITKKNKNTDNVDRSNPFFAGFPKPSITKFLPILLDNGYTVILVDQDDSKIGNKQKRYVSGIYSPGLRPLDIINDDSDKIDTSNLISIFVELNWIGSKKSIVYSICNINTSTNVFDVYQSGIDITNENMSYESILDELYRIMIRYSSREVIFNIVTKEIPYQLEEEFLIEYLDLYNKSFHWKWINTDVDMDLYKEYSKIDYQNAFFRRVYQHINFGLLEPLQYFEFEFLQIASINCIYLLEFISRHDTKYIKNISIPNVINEYEHMILELNTIGQLNILPNQNTNNKYASLFNVINKTKTAIGRRGLKRLLCKPYKSIDKITNRYKLSELLSEYLGDNSKIFERKITEICDFERLHRKMSLNMLHPYEFYNLHIAYNNILGLNHWILEINNKEIHKYSLENNIVEKLRSFMCKYNNLFIIDEMKRYNLNETSFSIGNFFKEGNIKEIDDIQKKIEKIEINVNDIKNKYEKKINTKDDNEWIKLGYTEQDGYYFTCTKIRGKLLEKCNDDDVNIKYNTNVCKITTPELKKLSLELVNCKSMFLKKIKLHYLHILEEYTSEYRDIFEKLGSFIEILDICYSNVMCKKQYNYCLPSIVEEHNSNSFIDARDIRHPIIERINQNTDYIPNDIILKTGKNGMILYALNSCGKSSLLRSIGLCIIMAQCGLYVPCSSFEYSPFSSIITQVDLYDNLWKSQSSFITEMVGLRKILKIANKNSLVLSDELTKGTEVVSATSIFAAAVLELVKKDCKFVFTTHLQDVAKLEEINENKKIQICHLSVEIKDTNITFERKLKPGPCSELYGLEVAKAVGLDLELMNSSFQIRNKLLNKKKEITSTKRSRYNKKKLLDSCEICNYKPVKKTDIPLDTHHIKFQCTADENNFTGHIHKNIMSNLVCLCKECHIKVHNSNIIIKGYVQTTSGVILEWSNN